MFVNRCPRAVWRFSGPSWPANRALNRAPQGTDPKSSNKLLVNFELQRFCACLMGPSDWAVHSLTFCILRCVFRARLAVYRLAKCSFMFHRPFIRASPSKSPAGSPRGCPRGIPQGDPFGGSPWGIPRGSPGGSPRGSPMCLILSPNGLNLRASVAPSFFLPWVTFGSSQNKMSESIV